MCSHATGYLPTVNAHLWANHMLTLTRYGLFLRHHQGDIDCFFQHIKITLTSSKIAALVRNSQFTTAVEVSRLLCILEYLNGYNMDRVFTPKNIVLNVLTPHST
jgi:hypothetical protein